MSMEKGGMGLDCGNFIGIPALANSALLDVVLVAFYYIWLDLLLA